MTAPERIWAYSDGLWIEAWDAPPSGAEYIRADLPAVTVGVKPDRETFDAMCAMRDAINEFVPMPSLESDLLQGPENSVFCSTVAEAVIAEIRRLRAALIPVTAPDPATIREAALREAVKSLRDWQNNLIQRLYPDSAITVGMAADVVEALIGEKK